GTAKVAEHDLEKAEQAARKASEVFEATHAVRLGEEAAKQAGELPEKATGGSEAREKADFQIEIVESLSDLTVENVTLGIERRRKMEEMLRELEHTGDIVDLEAMVKTLLGPLPEVKGLKETVKQVSEQFELQLYNVYYISSGRAERVTQDFDDVITEF